MMIHLYRWIGNRVRLFFRAEPHSKKAPQFRNENRGAFSIQNLLHITELSYLHKTKTVQPQPYRFQMQNADLFFGAIL